MPALPTPATTMPPAHTLHAFASASACIYKPVTTTLVTLLLPGQWRRQGWTVRTPLHLPLLCTTDRITHTSVSPLHLTTFPYLPACHLPSCTTYTFFACHLLTALPSSTSPTTVDSLHSLFLTSLPFLLPAGGSGQDKDKNKTLSEQDGAASLRYAVEHGGVNRRVLRSMGLWRSAN